MLEVRNLYVDIGPLRVVQGISISVGSREIVALLGRNGAGKTTFIKSLIGLIKPSGGIVRFLGSDITYSPPYYRAKLGLRYIPDTKRLFWTLTVEEHLLLGLIGVNSKKIAERLEYIYTLFPDLKKLRNLNAAQLSGGQQQMLNIARVIVNPDIKMILVDEPTEGLSPIMTAKITEALKTLADEGISMILVENKLGVVGKLANKVAIVSNGKIVLEGDISVIDNKSLIAKYLGFTIG